MTTSTEREIDGYPVAKHALAWLDRIESDGGTTCGNCGSFRRLHDDKRHIQTCGVCGEDAYDAIELALNAEDLP